MAKQNESAVLVQSLLIGAFIFALLTLGATFVDNFIAATFPKLEGQVRGGLSLFLLWLVITSTTRSIHRLSPRAESWKLLVAGVGVAIAGTLMGAALHWIIGRFSAQFAPLPVSGRALLFYGALGLVVAVISLINLRVRNKMLGDLLELMIIIGLAFAFFYFMK